jgi:ATP-dependent DNA helicase RecG
MENQNTEWKQIWKEEYLKTLCAFANTDGGSIEIGKDDKGNVVGIEDVLLIKLLKEIPVQIKNALAISADVRYLEYGDKHTLLISVTKYPNPVSYKGKFYKRVGSTTQELTPNDLDKILTLIRNFVFVGSVE